MGESSIGRYLNHPLLVRSIPAHFYVLRGLVFTWLFVMFSKTTSFCAIPQFLIRVRWAGMPMPATLARVPNRDNYLLMGTDLTPLLSGPATPVQNEFLFALGDIWTLDPDGEVVNPIAGRKFPCPSKTPWGSSLKIWTVNESTPATLIPQGKSQN
ncbi:MAG: hypothetical protein R3C44_18475 [Chloroflexota bacterium]